MGMFHLCLGTIGTCSACRGLEVFVFCYMSVAANDLKLWHYNGRGRQLCLGGATWNCVYSSEAMPSFMAGNMG